MSIVQFKSLPLEAQVDEVRALHDALVACELSLKSARELAHDPRVRRAFPAHSNGRPQSRWRPLRSRAKDSMVVQALRETLLREQHETAASLSKSLRELRPREYLTWLLSERFSGPVRIEGGSYRNYGAAVQARTKWALSSYRTWKHVYAFPAVSWKLPPKRKKVSHHHVIANIGVEITAFLRLIVIGKQVPEWGEEKGKFESITGLKAICKALGVAYNDANQARFRRLVNQPGGSACPIQRRGRRYEVYSSELGAWKDSYFDRHREQFTPAEEDGSHLPPVHKASIEAAHRAEIRGLPQRS